MSCTPENHVSKPPPHAVRPGAPLDRPSVTKKDRKAQNNRHQLLPPSRASGVRKPTGVLVPFGRGHELGCLASTAFLSVATARFERTADCWSRRVWRRATNRREPCMWRRVQLRDRRKQCFGIRAAHVLKEFRVGACSSTRPAYITATSSVRPATTPRSWVINIIAMRRAWRSRASRSRICACMVTSSAVVGSSAISSRGSQESAMAMATRCLIPPDI